MNEYLKPRKPALPEDEARFQLSRSEEKLAAGMKGVGKMTSGGFSERIPAPTGGALMIPVDDVVLSDQVRKNIDPEGLKDLAENIEKHGLINPITVRRLPSGKYEIVAGHRRFLAIRDVLGRDAVECRVLNIAGEPEKLAVQISENVQRENLHPVELADAVGRVAKEILGTRVPKEKSQKQHILTESDLGKLSLDLLKHPDRLSDGDKAFVAKVMEKCGVTKYQLAVSLYVFSLPEEVKVELSRLDIGLGHLRVMAEKRLSPEEVLEYAKMVHEKGLSASELRKIIGVRKRSKTFPKGVERVYAQIKGLEKRILKSRHVRENPEVRRRVKEELLSIVRELEELESEK